MLDEILGALKIFKESCDNVNMQEEIEETLRKYKPFLRKKFKIGR